MRILVEDLLIVMEEGIDPKPEYRFCVIQPAHLRNSRAMFQTLQQCFW